MKVNFVRAASMMLLCTAILCSCGKDGADGKDGKDGKDGVDGTQGQQGPQGPAGIDGNAEVKMYTYGSATITTGLWAYIIPDMMFTEAEKHLFYAYYYLTVGDNAAWIPVPGIGPNLQYTVQSMLTAGLTDGLCVMGIGLVTNTGSATYYTNPITFEKFRIIVIPIPEDNIIVASSAGSSRSLDWSNYAEVAEYFGLPE